MNIVIHCYMNITLELKSNLLLYIENIGNKAFYRKNSKLISKFVNPWNILKIVVKPFRYKLLFSTPKNEYTYL